MNSRLSSEEGFLDMVTRIILDNLSDEKFGPDQLVKKCGMSRYKVSKRLYSENGKNINQFIREIRLKKAYEYLKDNKITISEIAYKTGFNSPAYFNKCFHDHYGYAPGQVKFHESGKRENSNREKRDLKLLIFRYTIVVVIILMLIAFFIFLPSL